MSADDKPLDVQIGGEHYKSMAIQPMEYSMANKLDACQHTIIKYVTRFRDKGGIQDLEKAKHCIDLLIHFDRQAATVKESLTVHPVHPATFDHADPADVDIASAIDDDSERMQAIGQNGEMASEVYAAVDGWVLWNGGECPVMDGTLIDTRHRDGELWLGSVCGQYGTRTAPMFWTHTGDKAEVIAYRLHAK